MYLMEYLALYSKIIKTITVRRFMSSQVILKISLTTHFGVFVLQLIETLDKEKMGTQ